jgi:hypothetical protein
MRDKILHIPYEEYEELKSRISNLESISILLQKQVILEKYKELISKNNELSSTAIQSVLDEIPTIHFRKFIYNLIKIK